MNFDYRIIFTILTAFSYTYLVLCMFRVLMSWFGPGSAHQGSILLARATDPWLKIFSGIKWLKLRNLDFSPVAALMVLQLFSQIFHYVSISGKLTIGLVLATIIDLLASTLNFFLIFFIVLTVIRLLGILIKTSSIKRFWFTLDHILQPLVYPLLARLFPRRVVPYGTGLGLFLGVLLALSFLITVGFGALVNLIRPLGL